jgi:hypothetical protein
MHKLLVVLGQLADVVSGLTTLVVASQGFWDKMEILLHSVTFSQLIR